MKRITTFVLLVLIICGSIVGCSTVRETQTTTALVTEVPTEKELDFDEAISECVTEYDNETNNGSQTGWNSDIIKNYFVVSANGQSMEYIDPNWGASKTKGVKPSIAVKYMNTVLGLSDSVYRKMEMTRAIDGMQTDENDKVLVVWNYHPNNGLSVVYEKK